MSSVLHDPVRRPEGRPPHRVGEPLLPSIGTWWPALDHDRKRQVLVDLDAPLAPELVLHIRRLGGLPDGPVPARGVRLGPNDKAYLSAWRRAADFA